MYVHIRGPDDESILWRVYKVSLIVGHFPTKRCCGADPCSPIIQFNNIHVSAYQQWLSPSSGSCFDSIRGSWNCICAHCLSRAPRIAHPWESWAHITLHQENQSLLNITSKHLDCMYATFSSMNKVYLSLCINIKASRCICSLAKSKKSTQCHQHATIFLWLSLRSILSNHPISLCN